MVARLAAESGARVGQPAELWFDTDHLHLFDPETGRTLLGDGRSGNGDGSAPTPAQQPAEPDSAV